MHARLLAWAAATAISTLIAGCGGGSNAGPPPTNPIQGSINGFSFASQSSLANWSMDGRTLILGLDSWTWACGQTIGTIPGGGTEVAIWIPRAMVAAGTYQAEPASFSPDPNGIEISAARYPTNDAGVTTTWGDGLPGGTLWLTTVSATQIAGAVTASDTANNVSVSGTFSATICPIGDGGV